MRVSLAVGAVVLLGLTVPGAAGELPDGGTTALPPPNSCVAPILPCYIVLSIDSGSHGNRETVTGAHFWPGEPFTTYFWNGTAGAPAAVVGAGSSTGVSGSFAVSFWVPNDPVGNYTIFVTDPVGDNQSAHFHLTELHASPSSGPVGNTTSLSGGGFLPNHTMTFALHGSNATASVRCTTNRHGEFSGCHVTIPRVRAGTTRWTATDGTFTARIEFVVT